MLTRRCVLMLGLAALFLAAAPLRAQSTAPVLYRLDAGSAFHRGCYPPCTCPLFSTDNIRGTYTLTFDHADPLFNWYKVKNVNWVVTIDGSDVRITGEGTYRVGGQVAVQQQMTLKLVVGSEAAQTFDSGLVGGGGDFPKINITISVNGMYCFDTVIDVKSSPVPASEFLHEKLYNSTYEEGCFPPCQCPLYYFNATGACDLVPLPNASTPIRQEWAVVNVDWKVAPPGLPTPTDRHFLGFGTYYILQVGPSAQNQMTLDLTDSGTTKRFDSGRVSGGTQFPNIDINLSVNGFYCYDQAFFLHMKP